MMCSFSLTKQGKAYDIVASVKNNLSSGACYFLLLLDGVFDLDSTA